MFSPINRIAPETGHSCGLCLAGLIALAAIALSSFAPALHAQTQAESPLYVRTNTLGIFAAWSSDSSHILIGQSEQRKLVNIGASYSRRIIANRAVNWQYSAELLPVALESDPLSREFVQQTTPTTATVTYLNQPPLIKCAPATIPYSIDFPNGDTLSGTETWSCSGRRWTIGQAISPIGFQWNFLPWRRLEPFLSAHGGYMYSTKPIPVDTAGSFNFTFDIGGGVEFYRSHSQSIRVEYRLHHISNAGTAYDNPGIDNGLLQVSWTIGR
jgi:hypothetical protein